jgi:DNA-binding MarR family transcriptional regulator
MEAAPERTAMGEIGRDGAAGKRPAVDRIIHEPARYRITAVLYVVESADFLFLERQTGLTRGNLSAHLSKLEAAGYVRIDKEFVDRKTHTMLALTHGGRKAFEEYRKRMKEMLDV